MQVMKARVRQLRERQEKARRQQYKLIWRCTAMKAPSKS
jgi:hypothetical protein